MKLLFTSNDLQPSLTIFIISSMILGKHMAEVGFVYWQHKPQDKLCCESSDIETMAIQKTPDFNTIGTFWTPLLLQHSNSVCSLSLYFHEWKNSCLVFVDFWVLQQTLSTMYKWFHAIQELVQTLSSSSQEVCDQSPPWSFIDSDNCPTASPLALPWEPSSSARSFWASERADFAGSPCFSNSVIMCLAFAIASSFLENQT